jgi:hypothetical protein
MGDHQFPILSQHQALVESLIDFLPLVVDFIFIAHAAAINGFGNDFAGGFEVGFFRLFFYIAQAAFEFQRVTL